ncbi:magnesium or manganese-dependent protein phosphatase, partial [Streptomyces sviceus ATCC 29083]
MRCRSTRICPSSRSPRRPCRAIRRRAWRPVPTTTSPSPSTPATSSPASDGGCRGERTQRPPADRVTSKPRNRPTVSDLRQPSEPQSAPVDNRSAVDGDDRDGESSPVGRLAATVERLRREVRAAQAEADGRALIELAKGILVERLRCGPAQASRQLAELAAQAGVTSLEFAVEVINQASRDKLSEVTNAFLEATASADPPDGHSSAVRLRAAESGALAADDTQAVADSLLEHALTPLGAEAVAIWALGADGSLALAGSAGFSTAEAGRWRHVPPGVTTVARRGLTERAGEWIRSLSETGLPSIGQHHHPDGGRVAVPAETGGRIHGVLEIVWSTPLEPPPAAIVRQIEALAELCAHTLETNAPQHPDDIQSPRVLPDVAELMDLADGLHDPALVLVPHRGSDGHLVDFRIHHVNSRFLDPAGRPRGAVNGAMLLEAYPMAAGHSELFERVERVYATGEPFRAHRMRLTALVDDVPLAAVADVNVSRHGDSVLLIWRIEDETARLASLLQHAQRLGRIGGFEENLLTGEITWNGQLYNLYGRPLSDAPVPLEELPAHAHPDDGVAIGRFLRTVLHQRRPASTAFRLQRPDGVTRHIRVVAEPVLDSAGQLYMLRGAYQDISAHHWTEVALAATRDQLAHSEQQASERNRLTLQLQHAIMPPTRAPLEVPGLD